MLDSKPWTVGEWCGIKQYRCLLCPYDLLDDGTYAYPEDAMWDHYRTRHLVIEEEPAPVGVLVANKSGREVPMPVPEPASEAPKRRRRMLLETTESARSVFVEATESAWAVETEVSHGETDPDTPADDREVPGDALGGGLGGL